jgi:hypothetical protein
MKLITSTARTLLAGVSGEVPTGNLLWVDKINGNNSSALRGRMDRPFATLTAAKLAAVSGDTIAVLPGSYAEVDLAANGVNWFFYPGALISAVTGGTKAIFDVASTMTFRVDGYGEFAHTGTGLNDSVLSILSTAAPSISFKCSKMSAFGGPTINVDTTTVSIFSVLLEADLIDNTGAEDAISIVASLTSLCFSIQAISITVGTGYALYSAGGSLSLTADKIVSQTGTAITVQGGAVDVSSRLIQGGAKGVEYYSGTIVLNRARIVATTAAAGSRAVYLGGGPTTGMTANVRLVACVLIVPAAATYCLAGLGGARSVAFYGPCFRNKVAESATISAQVSTYTQSTDVV